MVLKGYRAIAVAAILACATPAAAQTITRPVSELLGAIDTHTDQLDRSVTLRVGVGTVFSSRLDADSNIHVYPLPYVTFQYKGWLSVDDTQVRVNLVPLDSALARDGFRAGPMVRIDPGRGNISRPGIQGLGKVPVSLELGGFVSYTLGPARLRVRLRQDVAEGHHGAVGEVELRSGLFRAGALGVAAQIQTIWGSRTYMETFYGVSPAQSALTGLPRYDAGAGFKDVNFALMGEYKFSPRWATLGAIQYVRLVGDAANSPISTRRGSGNRMNVGLFVVYTFGAKAEADQR